MSTVRSDLVAIALLLSFVGALFVRPPVSASGINITESDVEHSFAQHVTFTLEAVSEADISEVYLFFRATHEQETEKKKLALEQPSQEVSLTYTHDARRYPLPPFADITFWWQIQDAAGNQLKTAPEQFKYVDNRFGWEQISSAGITVNWMAGRGDPAFAQTALDIAQASVQDIRAELQAPMPDPLDIFIYDSEQNLEAAMVLTGRDWVGGQARPELGVVVISASPEEGYTSRMKRYLPHEITHLLIYELVTPEGYKHVPEWLDEGLATANERMPTPEYTVLLEEARRGGDLLSLEELCVPFPPDSRTAALSYAQSASVVAFIRKQHGAEGIRKLLSAYANGASCTSGVREALGVSLSRLESEWRMSLQPESGWRAALNQMGVWVGVWLLTLLVAVPMIGGFRRR